MEDSLTCPICGTKLTNLRLNNRYLAMLDKKSNYVDRNCPTGVNHSFNHLVDENTGKVDWVKLSYEPGKRWIEINNVTNKSRIVCMKDGVSEYIDISKQLEPDFPDLVKLKEKVSIYVLFS